MRKFFTLLKKETRELLTLQTILPMLISVIALALIGNIVGNISEKSLNNQALAILDLDNSEASREIPEVLRSAGFDIKYYENSTVDTIIEESKGSDVGTVLTIPKGFEEGIINFEQQKFEKHSIIKSFSVFASASSETANMAISLINEHLSYKMMQGADIKQNLQTLKNPLVSDSFVVLGNKTANINIDMVLGFISTQTMFIPIVIFIIIMMASQMIAVAIASEKENKTLETLLSTPISRTSLVTSKMAAAGLVSLLMSVAYMIGMRYYINGFAGGALNTISEAGGMPEAIKQLGLVFSITDYVLLGTSLFISILISLALSLILGAFAEDVKKAQGLIMPVVLLVMIPYMLTMFIDIESTSFGLQLFLFLIPFSHSLMASQNLFLQNYNTVLYGILYQVVLLTVLILIATRIFKSDKILAMKLSMPKKSKLPKK